MILFTSGIRARIVMLVGVALFPITVLTVIHISNDQNRRLEALKFEGKRTAEMTASHVSAVIEGSRQLLLALAHSSEVELKDRATTAHDYRELLANAPLYANIGLVDRRGFLVASAAEVHDSLDFSARSWFRQVQSARDFAIGEYQAGLITDRPSLSVAYPIESDSILSAVYLSIKPSAFQDLISGIHVPEGGIVNIIDRKGTIIARTPEPEHWVGKFSRAWPVYNSTEHDSLGFIETTGVDGILRQYVFVSVPGTMGGLNVGVAISESYLAGEINHEHRKNLFVLGITGVTALLLTWFVGGVSIIRHVRKLADFARRIGEGDISARVAFPGGGKEFQQLGKAFNDMSESLMVHRDNLEALVEQRTNELSAKNGALEYEIRERKRNQEIVLRLAEIVESTDEAIIGKNLDGTITSWNAGAEHLYGYSRAEAIGQSISFLIPTERADDLSKILDSVRKGEHIARYETLRKRKDGTNIDVSLTVSPIRNTDGEVIGVSTIAHDITVKKKAEEYQRMNELRLESLLKISQHKTQTIQDLLDFALDEVITFTGSKIGYIYHYDEKRQQFTLNSWSRDVMNECRIQEQQTVYQLDSTGLWGEAVRQRKPIVVNDFQAHNPFKKGYPEGHNRLERFLTIPVIQGETIVAVVGVANKSEEYNEADVRQLTLMMDTLWKVVDRHRAEEALKESESRFRRIIDNLQDAYILIDPDGTITMLSPSAATMYGYDSPDEMLGLHIGSLYKDPAERDRVARKLKSNGFVADRVIESVRKDGTVFWASLNAGVVTDDSGTIIGTEGIVRDITERKNANEALRLSHERFYAILSNLYSAVLLVSADNKVEFANQAFCDLYEFNFPPQQLAGFNADRILSTMESRHETVAASGTTVGEHLPVRGSEVRFKNGRTTIRDFIPLYVEDKFYGRLWYYHDVTEIKLNEEQLRKFTEELRRSNAELEQFAYIASHDLQEPLRMVSSYTQLLAKRYGDRLDADAKDFIGYAVDGAVRMQNLIRSLLTFSRVSRETAPMTPVECSSVVGDAIRNLQLAIEESHAAVEYPVLPTVLGTESQLLQLFQNLIGNAVKFRGTDPPHIRIIAEQTGDFWQFAVVDNGIGINSEYFGRIFNIFSRLHTREEYEGTGIGLAVCKKIVERHGGRIWVESTPGAGSTFFFTLPTKGR
jgi:PAS domain S-box-containing protein